MVDHHQPLYWGHMQNWILTKVKKNSLRKKIEKGPISSQLNELSVF